MTSGGSADRAWADRQPPDPTENVQVTGVHSPLGLPLLRSLSAATESVNRSFERLATGGRINRASDDPSGLVASENLGAQSTAIRAEMMRLERESIVIGAKEGALSAVSDMLIDLDAIVVQAANRGAVSSDEREALQVQANAIVDALRFTYETASFNGERLFEQENPEAIGSAWTRERTNAATGERIAPQEVNLGDLLSGGLLNLVDGDVEVAQEVTRSAVKNNATARASLGASQRTFYQPQINQLSRELEGVEGARSKIRDTDFAAEAGNLVRSQVLQEAAIRVIEVFRKSAARTVLGLLGAAA